MTSVAHKILIIDDDEGILRGLTMRLRAYGFSVATATDGESGLAAADAAPPSAVVLDINMPGMDGFTVLERLRQREKTKDIPVVMLSANVSASICKEAVKRGAQYFIKKPYEPQALIHALKSAIEETPSPKRSLTPRRFKRRFAAKKFVLIASNHEDLRQAIALRCEGLGLNTQTAESGLDVVLKVVENPPNLLILDVDLGDVGGVTVYEKLLANKSVNPIPVIFLTDGPDAAAMKCCTAARGECVAKDRNAWGKLRSIISKTFGVGGGVGPMAGSNATAPDDACGSAPKVLAVDDDQDTLLALEVRLRARGLQFVAAVGSQQGFIKAVVEQPDVIITDYAMPDGAGSYLIQRLSLSAATSEIPIIILTGETYIDGQENFALERKLTSMPGVVAYLRKPIDSRQLFACLKKCIELPKEKMIAAAPDIHAAIASRRAQPRFGRRK